MSKNKQTQKTQAPASKKKAVKEVKRDLKHAEEDDIRSVVYGSRDHLSKVADKYMSTLVDPKRNKGGKPCYTQGGYHRSSRIELTKAEIDFSTGTGNVGFLAVDPVHAAGVNDRISWIATNSTWTGTSSTPLPAGATAGVAVGYQVDAPFSAASVTLGAAELCSRVVACGVYLFPVGSATNQAGSLYMLETPLHTAETLHAGVSEAMNLADVEGHPRTRAMRGIQLGNADNENCLNWHPTLRSGASGSGALNWSDYDFREIGSPSVVLNTKHNHTPLLVTIGGAPGTQWHAEIYIVYEYIGTKAGALTRSVADSRGADMIFNALFAKNLSGWVGKPSHAIASYGVASEKQADSILSKVEKAASGFSSIVDSPLWGQAAGLARDVAGFIL